MSTTNPITNPIEQQPQRPHPNAAQGAGRFIASLSGWIKFFGSSALVALVGWLLWWVHAILVGGSSVFTEQIGFLSGPTVQVDAAHPVALKSYLDIYLHTKAFDENGDPLVIVPPDAEKRLGFWVHYQFVPDDFGTIEVRYFFAERPPKTGVEPSKLLREETPVLIGNVTALKGRQSAEYFFVQRPWSVSRGELIYLVFYQLGEATATGPQKQLLVVVSTPIDGEPSWPSARSSGS